MRRKISEFYGGLNGKTFVVPEVEALKGDFSKVIAGIGSM